MARDLDLLTLAAVSCELSAAICCVCSEPKKECVRGCMDGWSNKEESRGGSEGGVFTSSVIWGTAGVVLVEVVGMPAGAVPGSVISH